MGNTIGPRQAPNPATPAAPRRRQLGRRTMLTLRTSRTSLGQKYELRAVNSERRSGRCDLFWLSLVSGVGGVDWAPQTPTPDTFPAWLIICVAYKFLANSEIATPATSKTRVLSLQFLNPRRPWLPQFLRNAPSGSPAVRWLMASAATRRTATAPAFVATAFANRVQHASSTDMAGRRDRNAQLHPGEEPTATTKQATLCESRSWRAAGPDACAQTSPD